MSTQPQNEGVTARYAAVPEWIKSAKRWLLYDWSKIPHYLNGSKRGKTDAPQDWAQLATLFDACAAFDANPSRYAGLGFALGPDGTGNYWQGIDFDKTSSRPDVEALVSELPGYVEVSPSGDGFHAIGYGKSFPPLGSNGTGTEAYAFGRYFTVTGIAFPVGDNTKPVCLADFITTSLMPLHDVARKSNSEAANSHARIPLEVSEDVIADLRSALSVLPADDRSEWVAIGHALKGLGEVGFKLWMEWSSKSSEHNPDLDPAQWGTFAGDRTGYGAVFKRAQVQGWKNPRRQLDPDHAFSNTTMLPGAQPSDTGGITQISIADLFSNPSEPPQFLIEEILPAGVLTLLSAHGGAGKSMLALQAAVCVATGRPFFGKRVKRCRVLFYSAEDPESVIRFRLTRVCQDMSIDPASLPEWLKILDATKNPCLFAEAIEHGIKYGTIRPSYTLLGREADAFDADVVVIDNASDTFDANENERARVREFIRLLPQIRKDRHVAILLLAHVDKLTARSATRTEAYSGSTAWHNSARSRLSLTAQDDGLLLEHQKSNLGPRAAPIPLRWNTNLVLEMAAVAGDQETIDVVLRLVGDLYDRGIYISTARTASNNAYKVLRADPRFPRFITREALSAGLQAGICAGRLEVEQYQGASRHGRKRYRLAPGALDGRDVPPHAPSANDGPAAKKRDE